MFHKSNFPALNTPSTSPPLMDSCLCQYINSNPTVFSDPQGSVARARRTKSEDALNVFVWLAIDIAEKSLSGSHFNRNPRPSVPQARSIGFSERKKPSAIKIANNNIVNCTTSPRHVFPLTPPSIHFLHPERGWISNKGISPCHFLSLGHWEWNLANQLLPLLNLPNNCSQVQWLSCCLQNNYTVEHIHLPHGIYNWITDSCAAAYGPLVKYRVD